ncbi:TPA: replication regulatory protein RepA [Escherichia coli]|nr:replication regulatory protein RepA [Escherichia coli]HBP7716984.1 replication regulatory protein RepA [Escherichia coli]HBP7716993.1 replication regulatory protein RepA [Escherichia coli]
MSRPADKTTSSANAKRAYRKGKPMSASERQLAAIARKRETHKEVKVFVKNPLKDVMIAVCEEEGLTQAQFIERLLERELTERGLLLGVPRRKVAGNWF